MNVLLDTHALLWWVTNDPQLSDVAREVIGDSANRVFVSPASVWEMAIKHRTGKLTLPEPPPIYVPDRLLRHGFEPLPITMTHVLQTHPLPFHHRDPFDRLLIAQSIAEDMPLVHVPRANGLVGFFRNPKGIRCFTRPIRIVQNRPPPTGCSDGISSANGSGASPRVTGAAGCGAASSSCLTNRIPTLSAKTGNR